MLPQILLCESLRLCVQTEIQPIKFALKKTAGHWLNVCVCSLNLTESNLMLAVTFSKPQPNKILDALEALLFSDKSDSLLQIPEDTLFKLDFLCVCVSVCLLPGL